MSSHQSHTPFYKSCQQLLPGALSSPSPEKALSLPALKQLEVQLHEPQLTSYLLPFFSTYLNKKINFKVRNS